MTQTYRTFTSTDNVWRIVIQDAPGAYYAVKVYRDGVEQTDFTLRFWFMSAAVAMFEGYVEKVSEVLDPTANLEDQEKPAYGSVGCVVRLDGCQGIGNVRANPMAQLKGSRSPRYVAQCLHCHEKLAVVKIGIQHAKRG